MNAQAKSATRHFRPRPCAAPRALALAASVCAALAWPLGASAQTRFVAEGAEVTDTVTGLVWRRCSEGQRWTGSACSGTVTSFTWKNALARAQAASARGVPWRVPSVKELPSIVDDQRTFAAIDPELFPDTPSDYYWTSTHSAGSEAYGWILLSTNGVVTINSRSNKYLVRLVRGGR